MQQSSLGKIMRYHKDNYFNSPLLHDLFVSFQWQPIINEELISIFKTWTMLDDQQQTPQIIFLGKYKNPPTN